MNTTNLRDFLNSREKALTEHLAERKRHTLPFETELGEVRTAIKTLNVARNTPEAQTNELRRYLIGRERELRDTIRELGGDDLAALQNELAELQKLKATLGLPQQPEDEAAEAEFPIGGSPYQSMTIKDLVVTALAQLQPGGATLSELLDFFRSQWGCDIDRGSLSPQLSRLFAAGQITQFGGEREWYLLPSKPVGTENWFPYRAASGEIEWKVPDQARPDDVVGKVREINRPTLD